MTEEQKRGLEWLYNGYSFNKGYASKAKKEELSAKEWSAKMMALRSAVSIFWYEFVPDCISKQYGIEYTEYELVEINK